MTVQHAHFKDDKYKLIDSHAKNVRILQLFFLEMCFHLNLLWKIMNATKRHLQEKMCKIKMIWQYIPHFWLQNKNRTKRKLPSGFNSVCSNMIRFRENQESATYMSLAYVVELREILIAVECSATVTLASLLDTEETPLADKLTNKLSTFLFFEILWKTLKDRSRAPLGAEPSSSPTPFFLLPKRFSPFSWTLSKQHQENLNAIHHEKPQIPTGRWRTKNSQSTGAIPDGTQSLHHDVAR